MWKVRGLSSSESSPLSSFGSVVALLLRFSEIRAVWLARVSLAPTFSCKKQILNEFRVIFFARFLCFYSASRAGEVY